jgi:hypothetical protein
MVNVWPTIMRTKMRNFWDTLFEEFIITLFREILQHSWSRYIMSYKLTSHFFVLLSGLLWALFTHQPIVVRSIENSEVNGVGTRKWLSERKNRKQHLDHIFNFTIKHFIIPLNSINFERFFFHFIVIYVRIIYVCVFLALNFEKSRS